MLVLLGLLWAATLVLSADRPRRPMYFSLAVMLAFGLHFAAKVLIAAESGRRFHQDRQSGALELLLVTPLPVEDIVNGQREALRRQFKPAVGAICLVNVLTLWFSFTMTASSGGMPPDESFIFVEMFLGSTVVLWLDASALSWLGMWRGLTAKKYPRSVLATWGQVMLPPWLAYFLFIFIGIANHGGLSEGSVEFLILLWFGVGVVVDVLSIARARENLVRFLRSTVAESYDR